jgi:osmotically inducible protein OsmC
MTANPNITTLDTVLYTGKTHTSSGGRDGESRSSDGRLDIKLSRPGSAGAGTNPEQLFAAGWSACFIGAMGRAAGTQKVTLPAGLWVDAEVDLGTASEAFFLQARLNVHLPGLDSATARGIVDAAHQLCPYSKATRGNIGVEITLV